ncbi:mCG1037283, isoform CRA_b [Mus musculus]|nr:mCG1037283, isoform CRA_b [Mus musculus]
MVKATKKTHYLTQDVVPSTSASKPKTVKICHRQPCSKCSKKIRNPKVQKPKKKNYTTKNKGPIKARGKNYSVTTAVC